MTPSWKSYLHSLLILGRISNLPTVWSNCIAGWWLAEGDSIPLLLILCGAATALYCGGMFLNDAMDFHFDRQFRPERPIPSGRIPLSHVRTWGWTLLSVGVVPLAFFSLNTLGFGIALALSIVVYDAFHKSISWSPVLMGLCRFFLFLMAASTGPEGVTGFTLWAATVLAAYIVGLSYVAKKESQSGPLRYWPCLLLVAPFVLAWYANAAEFARPTHVMMLAAGLWIVQSLRKTYGSNPPQVGRTVSQLLSGIVLIDLLALAGGPPHIAIALIALFLVAQLFQRFIPAT